METTANRSIKHIYVSGKITGLADLNKAKFKAACDLIRQANVDNLAEILKPGDHFRIINPHDLPQNHDKEWTSYMRHCIAAVCKCDELFVLDDWRDSKGALVEIIVAKILRLRLYKVDCLYEIELGDKVIYAFKRLEVTYFGLFMNLLFKLR